MRSMMQTVNIHEAKTHLSKLVDAVMQGEEIIIARAGKPAAKLVPLPLMKAKRKPGALKGKISISAEFNDPLPNDFLEQFE